MRECGQEIEDLSSVRRLHFRSELPLKRGPRFFVVRSFSFFQKPLTKRESGQPNIVKIPFRIFGLRHSSRRSANRADTQTLVCLPRRTKFYDRNCHSTYSPFDIWRAAVWPPCRSTTTQKRFSGNGYCSSVFVPGAKKLDVPRKRTSLFISLFSTSAYATQYAKYRSARIRYFRLSTCRSTPGREPRSRPGR